MPDRALTIGETIAEIREVLKDYIEATYHIGNAALVSQRRRLLDEEGVLFRAPYIESTPRYTVSRSFAQLDLPGAAQALFHEMAHPDEGESLLYDPPYSHQATALELALRDGKSLVVTTGTGSGKTEAFLLPILGKLAIEAQGSAKSFQRAALRAILLYPMNALVNDQLARLRLLFGDSRVSSLFGRWAGRPARFARYTSRTLYPGVRTAKKDQQRLDSIGKFYVALLEEAADSNSPNQQRAARLVASLQERGKWPAKPDLNAWYGSKGQRWQNSNGEFVRAVMGPDDPELFTRHEVLANAPDILVTNYSMLEYMLMRPLERPVFDATRQWLADNPDERLLLVVDEAHLYRGAAGAEVGLLLRRLRARLGIPPERVQVICTSASFNDSNHAREFAAQLTGKQAADFRTVEGDLSFRANAAKGTEADARALAALPLDTFYESSDEAARLNAVSELLAYRGVHGSDKVSSALFGALNDFSPMSLLVNLTMTQAMPVSELGSAVFECEDEELRDRAVTALIALGSVARRIEGEPGLLPCRVHAFFRGLPGLWACLDTACSGRVEDGSPVGRLFAQPQDSCADCGSRTFELLTCRNCGSAYARAYTDDLQNPRFLWHEPGAGFESHARHVTELHAIDLLLEDATIPAEPAELDLVTGRLNPDAMGDRMRQVFLKLDRSTVSTDDSEDGSRQEPDGEFRPCGVCGQTAGYGRSSVQDHQTKGDQPFQALVTRQIQVQPPNAQPYSEFAPLRGRKVLAFSDSRQTAARLAPNLQTYSMQDVIRPLILRGWRYLESIPTIGALLSLEDLYLAVLIGARLFNTRLRPELKGTESLQAMREVATVAERGELDDPAQLLELMVTVRGEVIPQSLLRGIVTTITDRYYGFQSLALASVRERSSLAVRIGELPAFPGVAETLDEKLSLARSWIGQWIGPSAGIWFQNMNPTWWQTARGVRPHSGKFASLDRWFPDRDARKLFEKQWLPSLLEILCELVAPNKYRMTAAKLALDTGQGWTYCQACRTTQRPPSGSSKCRNCCRDSLVEINPDSDPVFAARKGYYRGSSIRALSTPPEPPMAIIAAEHTAQLNAAQAEEVFSKAEEHELLFQDVDIGIPRPGEQQRTAIDVLSCTTTMEVGIDIGTLSGVALRNMPPSRANYQQRSGRAGRRGNAVATVVAFGSADSHDEHYFSEPDSMIRGQVDDPVLTLDNSEIARRHVTAYLFQRYHQDRLPDIEPHEQPQLFEVLGTVEGFRSPTSPMNREDFESWLRENQADLREDVNGWLPTELSEASRDSLLSSIVDGTLSAIDPAIASDAVSSPTESASTPAEESEDDEVEAPAEEGEERANPNRASENLLDRLLYKGVLPRYAFPTDVVSFHVFDVDRSTRYRPAFRYAPSQGLSVALTQYAPGKQVWIDGKEWTSGALYSAMPSERYRAWQDRKLYLECTVCHYACTETSETAERGETRDCPACGSSASFGKAKNWIRPPGFAHPYTTDEGTSPDDQPLRSYATRAKLIAPGPADPENWREVTPRIREFYHRTPLLVTNTGPRQEGYTYCTRCGLVEPTAIPTNAVTGTHTKPYPDDREPTCTGSAVTRGLALGTDFISDVLLVGIRVDAPLTLRPGFLATDVALRTLSEAITIAATRRLEIEPGELQAEYRPALTHGGHQGLEAEIYVYDTLAGGAGFARRVADHGLALFEDTIQVLESCPVDCDRSCYRCLRSFKNRFEHALLDRHLGASLLRYLVRGQEPTLSMRRMEQAVDRLYSDLSRHNIPGAEFARNANVDVPGIGTICAPILARSSGRNLIIGLHAPLTPDYAPDQGLREAKEYGTAIPVLLIDEIVVSQNLPRASQQVIEALS